MTGYRNIKTQWVELILNGTTGTPNTQNQPNFLPQTFLNNKLIVSLEVYSSNDVPVSPNNNPLLTIAQIKGGFLTLYMSDPESKNGGNQGQWLYNLPLIDLHNVQNGTDPYVRDKFLMMPSSIVWEKSYIYFPTAPPVTAQSSVLFNVGYINNPAC